MTIKTHGELGCVVVVKEWKLRSLSERRSDPEVPGPPHLDGMVDRRILLSFLLFDWFHTEIIMSN